MESIEFEEEHSEKRWYYPEDLPRGARIRNFNDSFDTNLEERINDFLKKKRDAELKKLNKKPKTTEEELIFEYPNNTTDELLQIHPIDGEGLNGEPCFIRNPNYRSVIL